MKNGAKLQSSADPEALFNDPRVQKAFKLFVRGVAYDIDYVQKNMMGDRTRK